MNTVSPCDLSSIDLARAATLNLVAHVSWVQTQTTGMQVIETDDLVMVDSGLPCDTFNIVCRARLARATAPERIRAVMEHFAYVNRPYSWWLNPGDEPSDLGDLLLVAGLHNAESELAMAADLSRLRLTELAPSGLQVRRLTSLNQLQDFARIVAANWSPPDGEVLRFYEMGAPALLAENSPLWLYVGYLDETPVAASELTVGGGVVGLYNICTLMDYRRRGFGTALTLQPLVDALSQGYHTAILQASDEGALVYKRVGFEPFGLIREYKPLPA